jgi:hypothetical protein
MGSREEIENYHVSSEEAARLVKEGSPSGASCQIVSQTAKTTAVRCTQPFTLRAEILADAVALHEGWLLDMVGGLPWPTNIDQWRARLDTAAPYKTAMGAEWNKLTPAMQAALEITGAFYLVSATTWHGKPPGMPSEIADARP